MFPEQLHFALLLALHHHATSTTLFSNAQTSVPHYECTVVKTLSPQSWGYRKKHSRLSFKIIGLRHLVKLNGPLEVRQLQIIYQTELFHC